MEHGLFYFLGKLIFRLRWLIVLAWLALLIVCIPVLPKLMDPFKSIGFIDPNSQSAKANDLLNEKLGYGYNRFIVMYESETMNANQAKFINEIKKSLKGLKDFPIANKIIYPDKDNKQISKDKHKAYAVILFKGKQEMDSHSLKQIKSLLKEPEGMTMKMGGEAIFLDDTKMQTQRDLFKSEYVATPAALITMLIVFGSVVAAGVPVLLTIICALVMLVTLYWLGHEFSLSVFTINIALLLGLCLSLDYALLLVNRYRDELQRGQKAEHALAIMMATAGKAVFFSGLAVLISLSALLLFPINILFSVGIGGIAAVGVSVAVALLLLPAVLGLLKHRINWLRIRKINGNVNENSLWLRFITTIVEHPTGFFLGSLVLLVCLGYPFLQAKFGISDFRILPKTSESRQVFETFKSTFGESKLAPIIAIIQTSNNTMLTKSNISRLHNFSEKIKDDPRVDQVISIVNVDPDITKSQYQMLYTGSRSHLPDRLKDFLDISNKGNMTVMTIMSKQASNSPATTAFIKEFRKMDPGKNLTMEVTGASVNTLDVLKSISASFPRAFYWIVGFTYLILLIALRSIILPLKAIITTMLSLCASYGVLVLVIQHGYLHEYLQFEPQGMLDISLLIIIFCALFGISMDYEVFLLTRIKECYEQTHDNAKSIEYGIDRSSRIISSAAIIVILICFSFMFAEILMVKAFGLGIAVAVFIDAFVIRTVLVPATMSLLGDWNWYLPKWLDKILPDISFDPEHLETKD